MIAVKRLLAPLKKLPGRMIAQNDCSDGLDCFFGGKMIDHSCGTLLYKGYLKLDIDI